jgi:hypothetical protein
MINIDQINQTNNNLKQLLWQPLSELSKIRNAEKVKKKQVHFGKIAGKRCCVKCGKYFNNTPKEIIRRGELKQIYCIACDRTTGHNKKAVNYLKP